MNKQPSYYAILTADVRYDERLSSSEKLFYAEVTALSNKTGQCWASNKYFADLYGVSKSTVSGWVRKLCECGYVDVDYQYDGKQIEKRFISIKDSSGVHLFEQGCSENQKGGVQNIEQGCSENLKDNSTSINTTSNNTISVTSLEDDVPNASDSETWLSSIRIAEHLLDAICEWDDTHKYNANRPSIKEWVKQIDLAIRRDGRSEKQMNFMIDAVFKNNHKYPNLWDKWPMNIQSGKKLREKFDTIKNQIKQEKTNGTTKQNRAQRYIERAQGVLSQLPE